MNMAWADGPNDISHLYVGPLSKGLPIEEFKNVF